MGLFDSINNVFDTNIFHGEAIWDGIRDDPLRALVGAGDPFSTNVWNQILGEDWEPLVSQTGGITEQQLLDAQASGIDISDARGAYSVADTIALMYAGNWAGGAFGGEGAAAGGSTGGSAGGAMANGTSSGGSSIWPTLANAALSAYAANQMSDNNVSTTRNIANPFVANSGLFNAAFDPITGLFGTGVDDSLQGIQDTLVGQATQLAGTTSPFTDQLTGLGQGFFNNVQIDPTQIAQQQFDVLAPILDRQNQQQRLDQESRLFRQGRLGSTGGAREVEALLNAQDDARRNLLFESFGQGLEAQRQNAALGLQFAQAAPQLQGMFGSLVNTPLSQILAMQGAGLDLARVAGGLSGGNITSTNPNASTSQLFNQGLLQSGLQGLNTGIQQGFNSFIQDQNDREAQQQSGPF